MKLLFERKMIFVILFVSMAALAGFGQFVERADASAPVNQNATIPPPGGTLPPNMAGIQLLHLAPFATDSDVNAVISAPNVNAQYNNLGLGKSTGGYQAVTPGMVNGSITPVVGSGTLPFTATLESNVEYTTAIIGGANGWPVDFLTLKDTTTTAPALKGKIRIVHVAPFAAAPAINTAVNVVDQSDGSINSLFEGLLYAESTPYVEMPAGNYDWKVTLPNGTTLIDLPAFNLYSEAAATLYIVGDGTVQQPAGLYVIQELGNEVVVLYFPINRGKPLQ